MDDNKNNYLLDEEFNAKQIETKYKEINGYSLLSGICATLFQYNKLNSNIKLKRNHRYIISLLTGCLSFTLTKVALNTIYLNY